MTGDLTRLRRVRWAVQGVLVFGVVASMGANIVQADNRLVSKIVAAWAPVALLAVVEVISRVPATRETPWLTAGRIVAAAVVGGIAGWVSYWHMVDLARAAGEDGHGTPHLLPISVDGMIVVASVSLVILAKQLRAAVPDAIPAAAPVPDAVSDTPPNGDTNPSPNGAGNRSRRRNGDATRAAVAGYLVRNPDAAAEDIAAAVDVSLRTVQRHLAELRAAEPDAEPEPVPDAEPEPVNGRVYAGAGV